jgi:hypothetical protein
MRLLIAMPNSAKAVDAIAEGKHHGIRFFVHENPSILWQQFYQGKYRASEYSTGKGIPLTHSNDPMRCKALACEVIDKHRETIVGVLEDHPIINH